MNIDQLRQRFPNEQACRLFFESVMWQKGRYCPHCRAEKSWLLKGSSARSGLYQCSQCGRQFTVTTKTPMHSTKLPLWKWLLAMYYMVNSSKGISSVYLAKWVGISQKSAWKLGHAIRKKNLKPFYGLQFRKKIRESCCLYIDVRLKRFYNKKTL